MAVQRKETFRQISIVSFLKMRSFQTACTNKSTMDHLFSNDHKREASVFIVDLINDLSCGCVFTEAFTYIMLPLCRTPKVRRMKMKKFKTNYWFFSVVS